MTSKIIVNVAFNLSNPLHDLIIRTSLDIREKYNSSWYVDDKRYYFHFPLYLFAAPLKNKGRIIEVSKDFAKELRPEKVETNGLRFSDSGLVMVGFLRNKTVNDYHERAVELFNSLREGLLRDKYEDENYLETLPKEDREKLEKYGHIYVYDRYEPHITIAKIESDDIRKPIRKKYEKLLANQKSKLERFQVHEAIFGAEGRSELLVDEELC